MRRLIAICSATILVAGFCLAACAAISYATEAPSVGPTLTVTSPTGTGAYTAKDTLTVTWTSDQALSSGEFCVWARSATGGWVMWPGW